MNVWSSLEPPDFAERAAQLDTDDDLAVSEQLPRAADEHALGKRQRQIVELAALATEEGLKTADIAASIGYEVPNTYSALQALARYQVVGRCLTRSPSTGGWSDDTAWGHRSLPAW